MMPFSFCAPICRALIPFGLALLMTACVTVPDGVPADASASDSARSYHYAIDIGGRLSVRYQSKGNEESLHGSFSWEQTRDLTVITLRSPLGQTLARIEITPRNATLLQPGQPPRMAQDVDALTAAALGWPLPVSGLQHWLQGFAVLGTPSSLQAVAADSAVISTADGWRLRYVSWQRAAQLHPRRIDLERHTQQAGDVSLRIVVDRWLPRGSEKQTP